MGPMGITLNSSSPITQAGWRDWLNGYFNPPPPVAPRTPLQNYMNARPSYEEWQSRPLQFQEYSEGGPQGVPGPRSDAPDINDFMARKRAGMLYSEEIGRDI
jgi:hypothetical protein